MKPTKFLASAGVACALAVSPLVLAEIDGPDGEEFVTVFSVVLPPDVTSMTVPDEFLSQTDEFKFEVLAREESWNQTAVESCFLLDDGD